MTILRLLNLNRKDAELYVLPIQLFISDSNIFLSLLQILLILLTAKLYPFKIIKRIVPVVIILMQQSHPYPWCR